MSGPSAGRGLRRQRGFQVALLLLAALLAVVLVRSGRLERAAQRAQTRPALLPTGGAAGLSAIEIRSSARDLRLERAGEDWHLVRPLADFANARRVRELLRALESIEVVRDLGIDSLARYELDPPRVRITLERAGGELRELRLGTGAPGSGNVYATWTGLGSVVLVPRFFAQQFIVSDALDWREREILPFERAPIDSVWVETGGQPVRVRRLGPDAWAFLTPEAGEADPISCERTVAAFWRFEYTEFFDDPASLDTLGLRPPLATWVIFRGARVDTLAIGRRLDETTMAVRVAGRSPGRMRADLFEYLTGGASALEVRRPLRGEVGTVEAVVLVGATSARAYVRRENAWFQTGLDATARAACERGVAPAPDAAALTRVTDPAIDQDVANLFELRGDRWLAPLARDAEADDYPLRIHLWSRAGGHMWVYFAPDAASRAPATPRSGAPAFTGLAVGDRFPRRPMAVDSEAVWRWHLRLAP
jgi:hypothetical protein